MIFHCPWDSFILITIKKNCSTVNARLWILNHKIRILLKRCQKIPKHNNESKLCEQVKEELILMNSLKFHENIKNLENLCNTVKMYCRCKIRIVFFFFFTNHSLHLIFFLQKWTHKKVRKKCCGTYFKIRILVIMLLDFF